MSFVILDFAFLYGFIRAVGNYYRDNNTVLTAQGVTQKTLTGTRVLRWAKVQEFTMIGYTIHFPGAAKVIVNTAAYVEPSQAILDRVTGYISKASGEEKSEQGVNEEYSSPPPNTRVI